MKLNWNFLGGGGLQNKNLPWGEYGYMYILELHNFVKAIEMLDLLQLVIHKFCFPFITMLNIASTFTSFFP